MPEVRYSSDKKLDLSEYFDGQDAYIHIKKLGRLELRKIFYLSCDGVDYHAVKKCKELEKSGELDGAEEIKRIDFLNVLDKDEKLKYLENDIAAETIYLMKGVDHDNHNFTVDGKKITLDVVFWANVGNEKLVSYVIDEVKRYNELLPTIKKKTGKN